jgi:hypothetical protein
MRKSVLCAGRPTRLQKCNLSVSFLSEWAGQTVPIRLTRELRHETSSSFSTAHCRAWIRACLGAILGCGRGVQEPLLRLLREMGRAFAPEWIPSQDPRRRRCHGGQKESGDARSTGLLPYREDWRLCRRGTRTRRRHPATAKGKAQGSGSGRALHASRLTWHGKRHACSLPNPLGKNRRHDRGLDACALARHQQRHLQSPAG